MDRCLGIFRSSSLRCSLRRFGLGMAFWRNTLGAVPSDLVAAGFAGVGLLVASAQVVGKALVPTSTWFSRVALDVLGRPAVQGTVFAVAAIAGGILWRSVSFATFAEFDCGVPAPKDLQVNVGRRSVLQFCSSGGTWVDERQPISGVAPGYAPLRAASVVKLPWLTTIAAFFALCFAWNGHAGWRRRALIATGLVVASSSSLTFAQASLAPALVTSLAALLHLAFDEIVERCRARLPAERP